MNVRLKFFAAASVLCIAARIAEYHVQRELVSSQAVLHKSAVPSSQAQDDVYRQQFAQFQAQLSTDSQEVGLAAGEKILAEDPADTNGRAGNFLLSLCDKGQFQMALQFANEAPSDLKSGWLKAVFTRWTQSCPQDAIDALASIPDESARASLFQTIANTWAGGNPATLADFAESLPDSDNKTYALNEVANNWPLQDPEAFAAWLNTSPSGINADQAIADMISKTDGANRTPQVAMGWVEGINDTTLRYKSLMLVLDQWNESDPGAAQTYLGNVHWIDDAQRQQILKSLQTPATTVAAGSSD